MDLVFQQGNNSQNILTSIDRKSRFVQMIKNYSKHENVVTVGIKKIQSNEICPVNSITFDNGTKFANHKLLETDTYFCDPGCPWQKGSIENFNGMLRRYIDYRLSIQGVTQEILDQIVYKINNTSRQIL